MTKKTSKLSRRITPGKGVNLEPKTDAEALAFLRWKYGDHIQPSQPAADKPKDASQDVSEFEETRRWSSKAQCWLYPVWNAKGERIWVSIPD